MHVQLHALIRNHPIIAEGVDGGVVRLGRLHRRDAQIVSEHLHGVVSILFEIARAAHGRTNDFSYLVPMILKLLIGDGDAGSFEAVVYGKYSWQMNVELRV